MIAPMLTWGSIWYGGCGAGAWTGRAPGRSRATSACGVVIIR